MLFRSSQGSRLISADELEDLLEFAARRVFCFIWEELAELVGELLAEGVILEFGLVGVAAIEL